MFCKRVRRRIHGRTSCENGVTSAYAKRMDGITLARPDFRCLLKENFKDP